MSKYLCFGIAKQVIAKTETRWERFSVDEIKEDFFRTVDQDLYTVEVDDEKGYVYFNLKDEILAKNAIDLIKEQYEKYIKPSNLEEAIKYYDGINSKSEKERLELINTENNAYLFTLLSYKYSSYNRCRKI